MWAWGSMPPGSTIMPVASIVSAAPMSSRAPGRCNCGDLLTLDANIHQARALWRNHGTTLDDQVQHNCLPSAHWGRLFSCLYVKANLRENGDIYLLVKSSRDPRCQQRFEFVATLLKTVFRFVKEDQFLRLLGPLINLEGAGVGKSGVRLSVGHQQPSRRELPRHASAVSLRRKGRLRP